MVLLTYFKPVKTFRDCLDHIAVWQQMYRMNYSAYTAFSDPRFTTYIAESVLFIGCLILIIFYKSIKQ